MICVRMVHVATRVNAGILPWLRAMQPPTALYIYLGNLNTHLSCAVGSCTVSSFPPLADAAAARGGTAGASYLVSLAVVGLALVISAGT